MSTAVTVNYSRCKKSLVWLIVLKRSVYRLTGKIHFNELNRSKFSLRIFRPVKTLIESAYGIKAVWYEMSGNERAKENEKFDRKAYPCMCVDVAEQVLCTTTLNSLRFDVLGSNLSYDIRIHTYECMRRIRAYAYVRVCVYLWCWLSDSRLTQMST